MKKHVVIPYERYQQLLRAHKRSDQKDKQPVPKPPGSKKWVRL